MEDMPNCSINIKYNYASKADDDEDEDGIHLLWASDRLDVAREVDYQLTSIYSQLVILEKVMQDRETILDFLKHKIFDVVSRIQRSHRRVCTYKMGRCKYGGNEETGRSRGQEREYPIHTKV